MKPNDGHCHLSAAGVYTEAENQVKVLFLTPNKRHEKNYSEIPILRPPFGLPKNGLIREVVLISNMIS